MSHTAHQTEVDKAATRQRVDELVQSFEGMRCPFCGMSELFVFPPRPQRNWWVVGCDSPVCNSTWVMQNDTYDKIVQRIKYSQPK